MRYLTIALAKGRLAKQTMEMLEKIGIFCEEMKDEKLSHIWGSWMSRIIISPPAKPAPKGVFTAEFTRL